MQFLCTESHMSKQIDIKRYNPQLLATPEDIDPSLHIGHSDASSLLLDLLELAPITKLILFSLPIDKKHTFLTT